VRTIVALVAITVIALGLDAGLLRHHRLRDLLTPDPAKVVQGFVGAIAAARPDVARRQLADETRARLSAQELAARAAEFRARHGHYRFEDAGVRRRGDVAEVQARLRTERAGTVERRFRLVRESDTRLWKITEEDL
jgi:hypothetical protein